MYEQMIQSLQENGAQIIAFFGKIHPIAGAVITLVIGGLLAYLGVKLKKQKYEEQVKESGETIGSQTGKDQSTVGSVEDKLDEFLKK